MKMGPCSRTSMEKPLKFKNDLKVVKKCPTTAKLGSSRRRADGGREGEREREKGVRLQRSEKTTMNTIDKVVSNINNNNLPRFVSRSFSSRDIAPSVSFFYSSELEVADEKEEEKKMAPTLMRSFSGCFLSIRTTPTSTDAEYMTRCFIFRVYLVTRVWVKEKRR